jgi:hypothetical protein
MFEPPPRRIPSWIVPAAVIVGAAFLVAAALFGGPWYLLVLAAVLLWLYYAIRFLRSDRGKRILFSRFDDRPQNDPGRR